jgi:ACS family hexuronate transporter-like MFS transporter
MLAAPLVAWAILTHSWQFAFVLTGALGLAGWLLWLLFYQSPARHKALSARERELHPVRPGAHLAGEGARRSARFSASGTSGDRAAAVSRRSHVGHADVLAAALPDDGARIRSEADRALRLAAVPGRRSRMPFGGTISITLQKYAGLGLINARRAAFSVGATMMLGVAFVGTVQNPYVAVALLSLAGFAHQTLSVTVITMASDLFKRSEVATVAGMAGTCGNAGVLLFSLAMGALVARIGYTPFFIGLARWTCSAPSSCGPWSASSGPRERQAAAA